MVLGPALRSVGKCWWACHTWSICGRSCVILTMLNAWCGCPWCPLVHWCLLRKAAYANPAPFKKRPEDPLRVLCLRVPAVFQCWSCESLRKVASVGHTCHEREVLQLQIWCRFDVPFWCLPWRAITHKVWHVMWKRMDHPDTTLLLPCFLQVGTGSAHEVLCKRTFGWLYGHRGASLIQKWAKKGCWWSWNLGNDHYNSLQGGLDGWYDDGKVVFFSRILVAVDWSHGTVDRQVLVNLTFMIVMTQWMGLLARIKQDAGHVDMLWHVHLQCFFFKGNYEIRGGWLNLQTSLDFEFNRDI